VEIPDPDTGGIECLLGQKPLGGVCICVDDTVPGRQRVLRLHHRPVPAQDGEAARRRGAPGLHHRGPPLRAGAASVPDGGKFTGAVQECREGQWVNVETCPAEGYCTASATGYYCAVCTNGATRCKDTTVVEVCNEKGDQWVASECRNDPMTGKPSRCEDGECQACVPGTVRCSNDPQPDGTTLHKSLETCAADGSGWTSAYCPITGQCVIGAAPEADAGVGAGVAKCVPPGACPARGAAGRHHPGDLHPRRPGWTSATAHNFDQYATAKGVCRTTGTAGECFEPCATAARESSYLGCEYWAAVTSNVELDASYFKGNAVDGTSPTT
jgi:hypothetical protein